MVVQFIEEVSRTLYFLLKNKCVCVLGETVAKLTYQLTYLLPGPVLNILHLSLLSTQVKR
jgi:hypothetical protein